MAQYELRCRECGRSWGNQPRSICDECFSPLEITYDYDSIQASISEGTFSRERIAQRPPNMWRYSELLPLPEGFEPRLPVGPQAWRHQAWKGHGYGLGRCLGERLEEHPGGFG